MTVTKERLERILIGMADLINRYPETMPLLEQLEKDYHALRRRPEGERIRAMIAQHRKEDSRD